MEYYINRNQFFFAYVCSAMLHRKSWNFLNIFLKMEALLILTSIIHIPFLLVIQAPFSKSGIHQK